MGLLILTLIAGSALAFVAVKAERLSSRIGALFVLVILFRLAWASVAFAYAMSDDPSLLPTTLGAVLVAITVALGFIAFRRKKL